jgi:hypothetical protein
MGSLSLLKVFEEINDKSYRISQHEIYSNLFRYNNSSLLLFCSGCGCHPLACFVIINLEGISASLNGLYGITFETLMPLIWRNPPRLHQNKTNIVALSPQAKYTD